MRCRSQCICWTIAALGLLEARHAAAEDIKPRTRAMCVVSLACPDPGGSWGFSALPSATLGLIQIPLPIKATNTESQGWRDAFGSFSPSVGITNRLWFEYGWVDVHSQILYGLAVENGDDHAKARPSDRNRARLYLSSSMGFLVRRK